MTIKQELEILSDRLGGIIRPADVVQFGRDNPDSEIGKRIVWDDEKAGEQFRLLQAEAMIRTYYVRVEGRDGKSIPVRAWVSLRSDRAGGTGYRSIQSVMSDEQLRSELLDEAMRELKAFRKKYATLNELAALHKQIDAVLAPEGMVAEG